MSRRTNKELIQELRDSLERGQPWSCEFMNFGHPGISPEERRAIEAELKRKFELWRDSWITPRVNEIEERLVKKKKA